MGRNTYIRDFETFRTYENWGKKEKHDDSDKLNSGEDFEASSKKKMKAPQGNDKTIDNKGKTVNEAVIQRDDKYIINGINVTQSFINSFVKKVKDQTGQNIRQMYSDAQLAEELVKYMIDNNADVEKIPVSAILGGEEGEVEDIDTETDEADMDTEGEIEADEESDENTEEGEEAGGEDDFDMDSDDEFESPEGEEETEEGEGDDLDLDLDLDEEGDDDEEEGEGEEEEEETEEGEGEEEEEELPI